MNRHERWSALVAALARDGRLEIRSAARDLDVSEATVRRDIDGLAQQQMLTRTRGGAVANGVSYGLPLRYQSAQLTSEKRRIGQAAAGLVAPGFVVGMNGGTTTTEVARALAIRADLLAKGPATVITVVTNALNVGYELAVRPHVKIVIVGGVVRPQTFELVGPFAASTLDELALDVAILGVTAIDFERGASTHNEEEASINRLMASNARLVVVVADASKLGRRAFARICPIGEVDVLVTDAGADPTLTRQFSESGVRVVLA